MTAEELRLLKERRGARANKRDELDASLASGPLPVGEVRPRTRRDPNSVAAKGVDAELLDDDEEIIDTGLPVLP